MPPAPAVSVVIPAHDRADLIGRALRSVLGQTAQDFEVLVVDDASTDGTAEVARGIGDPRIVVLRHPERRGAQAARNTALRAARGRFIGFLDSDDEWLADKLEAQLTRFGGLGPEVGVVFGICRELLEETGESRLLVPEVPPDAYGALLAAPRLPILTLLVRRECLDAIGELDEALVAYQEWDLAIRLARRFRFDFLERTLGIYHVHAGPAISRDWARNSRGYAQVVDKHRPEILRVCGRSTLAAHYLHACHYALRGAAWREAWRHYGRAVRLAPGSWRAWALGPVVLGGPRLHRPLDRLWQARQPARFPGHLGHPGDP